MSEPIAVIVRGCKCPGTPHEEGDVVYVAPTLSLIGGLTVENDTSTALVETLANAGPPPTGGWNEGNSEPLALDMAERVRRRHVVTYVRFGAVGWNFEDERGPVPFDVEAILADYGMAYPVAEKCAELYGETVTRPLLERLSKRSPRGRIRRATSPRASTSQRNGSSSPPNGPVASKRLTA